MIIKSFIVVGKIVFNDSARMEEVNWNIEIHHWMEIISREVVWVSLISSEM